MAAKLAACCHWSSTSDCVSHFAKAQDAARRPMTQSCSARGDRGPYRALHGNLWKHEGRPTEGVVAEKDVCQNPAEADDARTQQLYHACIPVHCQLRKLTQRPEHDVLFPDRRADERINGTNIQFQSKKKQNQYQDTTVIITIIRF